MQSTVGGSSSEWLTRGAGYDPELGGVLDSRTESELDALGKNPGELAKRYEVIGNQLMEELNTVSDLLRSECGENIQLDRLRALSERASRMQAAIRDNLKCSEQKVDILRGKSIKYTAMTLVLQIVAATLLGMDYAESLGTENSGFSGFSIGGAVVGVLKLWPQLLHEQSLQGIERAARLAEMLARQNTRNNPELICAKEILAILEEANRDRKKQSALCKLAMKMRPGVGLPGESSGVSGWRRFREAAIRECQNSSLQSTLSRLSTKDPAREKQTIERAGRLLTDSRKMTEEIERVKITYAIVLRYIVEFRKAAGEEDTDSILRNLENNLKELVEPYETLQELAKEMEKRVSQESKETKTSKKALLIPSVLQALLLAFYLPGEVFDNLGLRTAGIGSLGLELIFDAWSGIGRTREKLGNFNSQQAYSQLPEVAELVSMLKTVISAAMLLQHPTSKRAVFEDLMGARMSSSQRRGICRSLFCDPAEVDPGLSIEEVPVEEAANIYFKAEQYTRESDRERLEDSEAEREVPCETSFFGAGPSQPQRSPEGDADESVLESFALTETTQSPLPSNVAQILMRRGAEKGTDGGVQEDGSEASESSIGGKPEGSGLDKRLSSALMTPRGGNN